MLTVLLALMLVAQLAIPAEPELPPAGPSGGGGGRVVLPSVGPVAVPAVIATRPLFAPRVPFAGAEGAPGAAPPSPLGGAVLAGAVGARGRRFAVLVREGRSYNVPVGGVFAGWRLVGIDEDAARFRRGGETVQLAFGASAPGESDVPEESE